MNNRIEWNRDELTELRKLEQEFITLRKWYLGITIFITLTFALSYICSVVDPYYRPFAAPLVLTVTFVATFSQFFLLVGWKTSYFFDDDCVGYKAGTQTITLKWAMIAAVETGPVTEENIVTFVFKPRPTKPLTRLDLKMTVEKDSPIYHQLMEKIASCNLPVSQTLSV